MKPYIYLISRNVYGKRLYYPNCGISEVIATIAGQVSFTSAQVKQLQSVYAVEISPDHRDIGITETA